MTVFSIMKTYLYFNVITSLNLKVMNGKLAGVYNLLSPSD